MNIMDEKKNKLKLLIDELKILDEKLKFANKALNIAEDIKKGYRYFINGNSFYNERNYKKAIENYFIALELIKNNPQIYYNLGLTYNAIGDYDEGLTFFLKATTLDSNLYKNFINKLELTQPDAEYFNWIGITYVSTEDYNKAIDVFLLSLKFYHNNKKAYKGLGISYLSQEEYSKALENYIIYFELNKSNLVEEDFYNIGIAYKGIGDYPKAIINFLKAVELNPKNEFNYSALGFTYYSENKYFKAIEIATKTLELFPDYLASYIIRGISFLKLEKYKQSLNDFLIFKQKLFRITPKISKSILTEILFHKHFNEYFKSIFIDCSIKFFLNLIQTFFELNELKFNQENYINLAEILDKESFLKKSFNFESKYVENLKNRIFNNYPNFTTLKEVYERDKKELFFLRVKLSILKLTLYNLNIELIELRDNQDIKEKLNVQKNYINLLFILDQVLQEKNIELLKKKEQEKAQVKIEERDRIIRNQAHNIKNILRSIINPLKYLQRIIHNPQIEEALKHAEIIREMVNATSLSYSGSKEDFIFDAKNNDKGISLKEMIITSIESSVGNIVEDIDYYSNFWEQYFPDDNIYDKALEEYRNLHEIPEKERFKYLIKFINKYMSKLDIKFRESERFILGNKKSSGVKILALFNDLISNAIKYTSFVPKDERFISIQFFSNEELITLKVENSYLENTQAETTGIGNLIIDNMIEVMDGKVSRNRKENNHFIIEIQFGNFWEGAINE